MVSSSVGWHGWTGEGTPKGEAWRTKVIYRTNMATSYAAGRMAQLQAANYKFWVYKHGNAREPRLQHLGWNGLVLPADHPFWETHYPPNGWGCTCHVAGARSEAGAVRRGGKPDVKLDDGWQTPLPKTGAPPGIGKGWGYAPGATVADAITALAPKLESLPPQLSIDLIQSWVRSNLFADWALNPTGNFPLARISDADAAKIGSVERVVAISPQTMAKQIKEHPELSNLEYANAQRVIANATTIIQDTPQTLTYILEEPGETGHMMIVKATKSGKGLFVTSFRRISGDPATLARLLRQFQRREIN